MSRVDRGVANGDLWALAAPIMGGQVAARKSAASATVRIPRTGLTTSGTEFEMTVVNNSRRKSLLLLGSTLSLALSASYVSTDSAVGDTGKVDRATSSTPIFPTPVAPETHNADLAPGGCPTHDG